MNKKICLFVVIYIILGYSNILSQDLIDPPKLVQFDTTTAIDRSINHFIRAWNWGGPGAMLDSAMFINTYHGFIFDSDDYLEDTHLMTRPDSSYARLIGGRAKDFVFNAHCLYLNPKLIVDSTQEFIPLNNDNTGAVFGFIDKSYNVIDTNANGIDINKLVLKKDRPVQYPVKVLSNIWKNDCLRWLDYDGGDKGGDEKERTNAPTQYYNDSLDRAVYHVFNGKQWYISINLRAINISDIQNHLDETILVIKLPYILTKIDTSANQIHYYQIQTVW